MSSTGSHKALQLSSDDAAVLYCAAMLGVITAYQGMIPPTPKVLQSVNAWADLLRDMGDEKVIAVVDALYTVMGGE